MANLPTVSTASNYLELVVSISDIIRRVCSISLSYNIMHNEAAIIYQSRQKSGEAAMAIDDRRNTNSAPEP